MDRPGVDCPDVHCPCEGCTGVGRPGVGPPCPASAAEGDATGLLPAPASLERAGGADEGRATLAWARGVAAVSAAVVAAGGIAMAFLLAGRLSGWGNGITCIVCTHACLWWLPVVLESM